MTAAGPGLELDRPRDLGALLSDATRVSLRHWLPLLAVSVLVVVPVEAAVLGLGLGQFEGGYDSTPPPAAAIVPALTRLLVWLPLMAVITLHALVEVSNGERPSPWRSLVAGLDAFAPVFWPVLIGVLLMAVTVPLIVVPFVLLVRLYFVPQLVMNDGKRGTDALRASWELTRGAGWRTAGLLLVAHLLFSLVAAFVSTPLAIAAQSADSEALFLAGTVLGDALIAAPLGLFGALLYFDLRSRARARATP